MRMRKRVITGLAAVLTAAVLAGCGSKETVMEQYEDTLAVTIDGKEIMLSDAMYQIFGAEVNGAYYESVYQNYYGVSFWDQEYSDGTGADPVSMRDYMKAQTMDSIIMYEILAMEAEKAGMTLDEDEVSEYREQIAQLLNQEEESAAEGIEHVGFTEDNLDEEFRILSLAFKYYEYLEEGLSVDEEAIRAGMDFEQVMTAACLIAAVGSIVSGLASNLPFALAPGLGFTTLFTYTFCQKYGCTWQQALALVFLSGALFLLLSLSPLRERLTDALPMPFKFALSAGVGLFLTLSGLINAGLVTAESMSAYLTYKPHIGIPESKRTVISNIHKGGTTAVEAGAHIAELIKTMLDKDFFQQERMVKKGKKMEL